MYVCLFFRQCCKMIVILNGYLRIKEEVPDKKEIGLRMGLRRKGMQTYNPKCGLRDNKPGPTRTGRGLAEGPAFIWNPRGGWLRTRTGRKPLPDTVLGCVLKTNLVKEKLENTRFHNKVQLCELPSPAKKLSGCSSPLILPVNKYMHVWKSLAFASWSISKG